MPEEFSFSPGGGGVKLVEMISRREVDRHKDLLLGLTASTPRFAANSEGRMEYTCSVRVGVVENQGLVEGVIISQWAQGIVTDFNIPVILERSVAGRLTIIARAEMILPDVRVTSYSYGSLGVPFIANLSYDESTGKWYDGFGYESALDPYSQVQSLTYYAWQQGMVGIDDLGEDEDLDATYAHWVAGG
jgi:hypothetical protein